MKGIEDHPAVAELIADVSLGAPTPHAAEFLLAHLSRTNLAAPRTGEFLKHVALHLPAERLGELAALVETIKDAPLPQRLEVADNLAQAIRQRGAKLPEALAAWTQRVMIDALGTSDDGLLKRAIESVRESKSDEKFEPLARVIQDPKRHGPLRAAALEAVANIDLGPAALAGALADPSSMTLRKKAAELLGQQVANANVEHTLLAALPCAPWELATSIAAGLAKTDASSLALLTLIETGKASPALLRNKTVATALSQRPAAAKERAAALTKDLPPEDARLDGVIAARVAEFRAAKPDAKHGEQVFQQACAACHKVKNVGGNLAPNLDAAAARGLHRLLEDILDPNRNVDPAFAQVVVETTDGQLLAGVGPRAEGELIVMNDAAGKPVSVPKAQIKTQTQSRLSLMPPTFETTLSGRDLNDLVAYLNAQTDTPTRSAK